MRLNDLVRLAIYLLASQCIVSAASANSTVTIPVNIAYAVDSLWTRDEILRRFAYTKDVYAKACPDEGIRLELQELVPIHEPELQELDKYLSAETVIRMKSILSKFRRSTRPTLIYIRRAPPADRMDATEHYAQAFNFEGPRPLPEFQHFRWNEFTFDSTDPVPFVIGNLSWERFEELKAIHGTSLIAQAASEKHSFNITQNQPVSAVFGTDAHELGHILLNDGSHRFGDNQVMDGFATGSRTYLDPEQCKLIAAYPRMEALREAAVRSGMQTICSFIEEKHLSNRFTFCIHK